MNELENLKEKLFELVECVDELETNLNGDKFVFTKEQLLNYSRSIINNTIKEVTLNIKSEVDGGMIDEIIDLNLSYNRAIEIDIDIEVLKHQIISIIEDSINVDIEEFVDSTIVNN
jgi:hypothetical protein